MRKKIFSIGSHKTGTTSLEECLKILGYNLYPVEDAYLPRGLIYELEDKNYSAIYDVIREYDAFSDSPFNHGDFYKDLYNNYPDVLFILSIRNTDTWIKSLEDWNILHNLRNYH